jgi:putative hemolysin
MVILVTSLGLSAFFSSAETALTALSETKARQLIESRESLRKRLYLWLERPNHVLTTILIGNNAVNIFAATLTTLIVQQLFKNQIVGIATGVTTIAILIFGEISPKTYAKHNPEKVAPAAMLVIKPLYFVLRPAVIVFTWLSRIMVKLSGGTLTRSGPFVTEEDISFMIQLGKQEGVIEPQEQELLSSIFEFGDTVVREVMINRTDIVGIPFTSNLEGILGTVESCGHTRVPVYGESIDDIKGFFHAKELLRFMPDKAADFSLAQHIRDPFFVPELMKISELLKEFQRRKTHMAVVVDEYGGTAGIVCLEDILEEIVGEIRDEFDQEPDEEFRRVSDNHYFADGKANIWKLGEELDIAFPDNEPYETLGGFLISRTGKLSSAGDRFQYKGWLFVVSEADNKRITRVEIEKISFTDNTDDTTNLNSMAPGSVVTKPPTIQ